LFLLAQDVDLHTLGGQGAFDEDDLALAVFSRPVGHALRFEVERLDLQPFPNGFHGPDYPGARHGVQKASSRPTP
jgi:hypothetical protein